MPEAPFTLPEDLTGLTEEQLADLLEQATSQFDEIYEAEGGPRAEDVARATGLADAIEQINGEKGRRDQATADAQQQLTELRSRVHGGDDPDDDGTLDGSDGGGEDDPADSDANAPAGDPALVAAQNPPTPTPAPARNLPARTGPRELGGVHPGRGRLNASLRTAQANAPTPVVPNSRRQEMVITASSATAGAPIGSQLPDLSALAKFITQHARSLTVTNGSPAYTPFATIQRTGLPMLGENSDPAHVQQVLSELTNPEVLVAAGGWCAPSEVRYDFFNVACQERTNLVDLPGIGIDRGGIRWPVSPSLADVFGAGPAAFAPFGATFSVTSVPWLWTEASDILAVTGGATKPCIRIPCSTFLEARLECYGLCVTAGNLADAAFPEATENFLRLMMASQIRVENFRYLTQMASLSTLSTAASGIGAAGAGTAAPVLGAVELAAIDYRSRYGMCQDDILEVVFPYWINGAIRSDLAKRTGVELLNVTDGMIADWFDARGVKLQLVGEYQERTAGYPGSPTPLTGWPAQVEFMMYAAGTFVRGDGMTLDLGVVRDSVLNATNDHTAAWSEECHLIAMFGNAARRYIVNICTDGTTGAADLTACSL